MGRVKKAVFEDYKGKRQFDVWHPRYGRARVIAPDGDAAMVAAAKVWGTSWTRLDFYTACAVRKV